jgi:ABC-2 type transport system permease protein
MPIFDQGYQHWNGPLAGHTWRWLAVSRHGVRSLTQNRFVRLLLLVAWLPAIALVGLLAMWGLLEQQAESVIDFLRRLLPQEVIAQPKEYRTAVWTIAYSYFFKAELVCSLFLVLIVGPNLISRDLRFNALPLYFSRPLTRLDYFLGKLGVVGFFLAATVIVPATGAYLLGVSFSLDVSIVRDTHRLFWSGLLYGLIITVSAGTLMLALSSLSRRSIYVGLAWAGFVFLTLLLSSILIGVRGDMARREVLQTGMTKWIEDHPAPPGIRMQGIYPNFSGSQRWMYGERPGEPPLTAEEKEKQRWFREWSAAQGQLYSQARDAQYAEGHTDWRPVISYATNLDRMGDWLLDTDAAWVTLGKTLERPRQAVGPMFGGRRPPRPAPDEPVNERRLAERMVWQFPWYWSAGVLGGMSLVSVWVLSRRVKSLDRLK